jgi:hypothetical protein
VWDEDAYKKTYPVERLVEGMMAPEMVLKTVEIVKGALEKGVLAKWIINNQAGGNAPVIAPSIAKKFMPGNRSTLSKSGSLW